MKKSVCCYLAAGALLFATARLTARITQSPSLASPSANAAIAEYVNSVKHAAMVYHQSVLRADRVEYHLLINARIAAMRNNDADDVVAITNLMHSVRKRLRQDQKSIGVHASKKNVSRPTVRFTVSPSQWLPLAAVKKGDIIVVRAAGTWQITHGFAPGVYGPDGGTGPHGGWYRLGLSYTKHRSDFIGLSTFSAIIAPLTGEIYIGCRKSSWENGTGHLLCSAAIYPPPAAPIKPTSSGKQ